MEPVLSNVKIRVNSVHDADTFRGTVKGMGRFDFLGNNCRFRLAGVNAPDLGRFAECDEERAKAAIAKRVVVDCILPDNDRGFNPKIEVDFYPVLDKYGRFLVDVRADDVDLAGLLLETGLAKPYDGGTKLSWC